MAGAGLARAIWIPSAIGLVGSIGFFATQPFKIEEPGKLKAYAASDKSFGIKHPSNWKPKSLSMHGIAGSVHFEPSNQVAFEVDTDLAGSLMADVGRSVDNSQANLDAALSDMAKQNPDMARQMEDLNKAMGKEMKKTPVEKLHETHKALMETRFKKYQEKSAPTKTTLAGLEAMETEFTFSGDGLWGPTQMTGKLVSALTSERAVRVLYYAPSDQMSKLGPVFKEMCGSLQLANVGSGVGGGPQ